VEKSASSSSLRSAPCDVLNARFIPKHEDLFMSLSPLNLGKLRLSLSFLTSRTFKIACDKLSRRKVFLENFKKIISSVHCRTVCRRLEF